MPLTLTRKIILEGAGGTGKSLLGRQLAELLEVSYFPSITREVHAEHGTKPGYHGCPPAQVAGVQREMALRMATRLNEGPVGVYDRGVPSVYAYTLLECSRMPGWEAEDCVAYTELLLSAQANQARSAGDLYLFVPPNIPLEADGVRQPFTALRTHVSLLIRSLLAEAKFPRFHLEASAPCHRLQECLESIADRQGKYDPRDLRAHYADRIQAIVQRDQALLCGAGD
jgi:nicotinamide riboside kinase